MRIVDAHHHLWDPHVIDYALLRPHGPLTTLAAPHPAVAFDAVAADHGVSEAIAVEATSAGADPEIETTWLLEQVARSTVTRRVVAWAPIEDPNVGAYVDELLVRAERMGVRVVGVRRSLESVPAGFIGRPEVIAGIRAVAQRGLTFDLVLFGDRLAEVVGLVSRVPEARFVLDHLGKPVLSPSTLAAWRGHMTHLGRSPNVTAKLSGLATGMREVAWEPVIETLVRHAVETFGWQRLMFASDWPICELAGGYARWMEFLQRITDDVATTDRLAFWAGTADRAYAAAR